MDEENRLKITLWLKPGIVRRMDGWLEEDNCKSRGEFAEKALRFYMGYLATEDTSEYLSRALVDALRGTLADNENRLRTLLFKLCVEVSMLMHIIAYDTDIDLPTLEKLRARCVQDVRRTHGQISFKDILKFQKEL